MDEIRVDPTALEALADTCYSISAQLDRMGDSVFYAGEPVLGDPRLADALSDYHRAWSDRRAELIEALDAAGRSLYVVAESFTDQDSGLAELLSD